VCLFLVLVVLLQQGKGADLAGAFGGGGSQASFGPRTSTNIMHRLTTVSFVLFVVLSMTLAILSGKRHGSVMEAVAASPPPASSETAPAGQGTPDLTGPIEGEVVPAPEQAPEGSEQPPGS
jgi:preprotein translocase subunit SecG